MDLWKFRPQWNFKKLPALWTVLLSCTHLTFHIYWNSCNTLWYNIFCACILWKGNKLNTPTGSGRRPLHFSPCIGMAWKRAFPFRGKTSMPISYVVYWYVVLRMRAGNIRYLKWRVWNFVIETQNWWSVHRIWLYTWLAIPEQFDRGLALSLLAVDSHSTLEFWAEQWKVDPQKNVIDKGCIFGGKNIGILYTQLRCIYKLKSGRRAAALILSDQLRGYSLPDTCASKMKTN